MKHKRFYYTTFLSALCLLLSSLPVRAQQPQASTADNPVWYYIQVLGDGDRTGRAMTELTNGDVYGRGLVDSDNAEETAPQLWRVEIAEGEYRFVNRQTGRYMNVRYDDSREIGMATTTDQPCGFRLAETATAGGGYFNIVATHTPTGGDPSEIYLHQANSGGSRDYVIMMVGTGYSGSENSAFRFVEFEENTLSYSDEETTRWYRIYSAKTGLEGLCLQQNAPAAAGEAPFRFAGEQAGAATQEWKLTRNSDGTTVLCNRATGDIVSTESKTDGLLNIVQSAVAATAGKGWILNYIGQGQYTIAGEEADGITRYLSAAEETELPEAFKPAGNHQNTSFAFRLKLTEEISTDIPANASDATRKVRVENGRIRVDGNTRFSVFTASGLRVSNDNRLPSGIYLVSVGDKTVKVYVR